MNIKDRLQIIITKNNLNASSFADKLNIQRSNLSHILSGRNKPSLDFIEKFITNFPNEDLHWLITGNENLNRLPNKELNNKQTINENPSTFQNKGKNTKKEIKIITFYEDNTFEIFYPNS